MISKHSASNMVLINDSNYLFFRLMNKLLYELVFRHVLFGLRNRKLNPMDRLEQMELAARLRLCCKIDSIWDATLVNPLIVGYYWLIAEKKERNKRHSWPTSILVKTNYSRNLRWYAGISASISTIHVSIPWIFAVLALDKDEENIWKRSIKLVTCSAVVLGFAYTGKFTMPDYDDLINSVFHWKISKSRFIKQSNNSLKQHILKMLMMPVYTCTLVFCFSMFT